MITGLPLAIQIHLQGLPVQDRGATIVATIPPAIHLTATALRFTAHLLIAIHHTAIAYHHIQHQATIAAVPLIHLQ